jgi:hypothetical protein
MCLRRYHDGCGGCEKKAIKLVNESGRDLNEIVTDSKNGGKTDLDLYVGVRGFDGDPSSFWLRSSIDILRGVCRYCKNAGTHVCDDCMWAFKADGKDHWMFDER